MQLLLPIDLADEWQSCCNSSMTLGMVYISSLPAKAALLGNTVRARWGLENSMRWVLDVAFREDDCRIRCGDAAQNFAILCRIALNLLKSDTRTKLGIANKRLKAGWDVAYLSRLLGF